MTKGLEKMRRIAEIENVQEYGELLLHVLPHVIHTERENERCTALLEKLLAKRRR